MAIYQFYGFTFNSEIYQLTHHDIKVNIRPKTALLLNYLIENRGVMVNKEDLFNAIWQTPHVQNHTLFQVISEVRKLTNEDLIRTQPNRGYQWVAPTNKVIRKQNNYNTELLLVNESKNVLSAKWSQHLAIATSASLLIFSSFYLGQWSIQNAGVAVKDDIINVTNALPAINSYAKGIVAFEEGHYSQAKQWFDFSLLEDPSSIQSKLMLAESYFKLENFTRAQDMAFKLLDSLDKNSYHYSSAANLLSRMYAKQGLVFDALNYAITGANSLQNSTAFCSIEVSDQRIKHLAQQLTEDKSLQLSKDQLLLGYYKQSKNEKHSLNTPSSIDLRSLCEQVNTQEQVDKANSEDTSACLKQESTTVLLSYNYSTNRKEKII